ncbi:MAG: hypothetical protein AABW81_00940 [Nanoarchaeota archaeon]
MVIRRYRSLKSNSESGLLKKLINKDYKPLKAPVGYTKLIRETEVYYLGSASILINPPSDYLLTIFGDTLRGVNNVKSYLNKKLKSHNIKLIGC